jgi:hypothetical protein
LKSLKTTRPKKKYKVTNITLTNSLDVLKFCGVVNDRMTLNEFKEFFRKNLWHQTIQ